MNKTLLLLFIAFIVFSCREDDIDVTPLPPTPINVMINNGDAVTAAIEGVVIDEENKPIAEATVKVGNTTVSTNIHGRFYVTNVMTYERALMTFSKEGYFSNYKTVHPKDGGISHVTVKLQKEKLLGSISSESGGTVGNEMVTLNFPANAIKDYTGTVNVYVNYIDPSAADFTTTAPTLEAVNQNGNLGALISYGMANIELQDANGNELELAENVAISLSLAVPNELLATAPTQIPLWSFNETEGVWVEEGEATLENGVYTGNVWHFSLWNCDTWEDTVCEVEFQLVDQNNENINTSSIIRFTVETEDGESFVAEETTNSDGSFEACLPTDAISYVIEVLPNSVGGDGNMSCILSTINLTQVSYNDVNEIQVPIEEENQLHISGTVTNCDNLPLENGLTFLESNTGEQLTVIVTDGVFNANALICGDPAQSYEVSFYDSSTYITSDPTALQPESLGDILGSVCEGVFQEIVWQGDLNYLTNGEEFFAGGYNVVEGDIQVPAMHGIYNVDNLINLKRVTGKIRIEDSFGWATFSDITGLKNLREVEQLILFDVPLLRSLEFDNLTNISYLNISLTPLSENFSLPQVTTLDSLKIYKTNLENFDGLNLSTVNSKVSINRNTVLEDYCSISDAIANTETYIVEDNRFDPTQEMLNNGSCTGAEEVDLEGNLETMTLTNDKVWVLNGLCFVNNGETLTIEPGTIVKVKNREDGGSLIIQPGGKIIADATSSQPIIFTSHNDSIQPGEIDSGNNHYGYWGGIVLAGNAPVSSSTNSGSELGTITLKGWDFTNEVEEHIDVVYGGNETQDNSGILNYVSIRHTGHGTILPSEEYFPGLTLAGVGSNTTIENVEMIYCSSPISIHGGSVNINNIVGAEYQRFCLNIIEGHNGTINNSFFIDKRVANYTFPSCIRVKGNDINGVLDNAETKVTNSTIYVDTQFNGTRPLIITSNNSLSTFESLAVKNALPAYRIIIEDGTSHVSITDCEFNRSESEIFIFESPNYSLTNNSYNVNNFTVGADESVFDWTYAKYLGLF